MALPTRVELYEVGPREGFQLEPPTIPTSDKVRLIRALTSTGLRSIEVTAFVSPKWVPQMADAEALVKALPTDTGVDYTCLFLNQKGLERAFQTPGIKVEGLVLVAASDTFSRRNTNRSTQEKLDEIPAWVEAYAAGGLPLTDIGLMTAFGCNYEGEVPLARVMEVLQRATDQVAASGQRVERIRLFDTMGWGNPVQVKHTVAAIWSRWPDVKIRTHFHDTRGTGMANVYAALEMGVTEFESAVGGLGGCPYAGNKGAAGNVPTEDVAFLCRELGISTGVDLGELISCVGLAEEIVGRTLPGKVSHSGYGRPSGA
ncbi:MAG TPA: hydroxymethylglutaryl-CoA lyase [Symbiobacteriaceae bacterium]|jgi:hydroxymethylglutaryl-CoA lyase